MGESAVSNTRRWCDSNGARGRLTTAGAAALAPFSSARISLEGRHALDGSDVAERVERDRQEPRGGSSNIKPPMAVK